MPEPTNQIHRPVARLRLAKDELPLTIKRMPGGWFTVTCRTVPGLLLFGQDLENLREEAREVAPLLLRLNAKSDRRP